MKRITNLAHAWHFTQNHRKAEQLTELLNHFKIVWIKAGNGELLINGILHPVCQGQLFCLFPSQHFLLLPGDGMDAYLVSFSEDVLLLSGAQDTYPFSGYHAGHAVQLLIQEVETGFQIGLESIMTLLIWDHDAHCPFGIDTVTGVIQILAVYFSRKEGAPIHISKQESIEESLFQRFINLLDKHYMSKKSVMQYANALAVTPNYLSDKVKKISGHTASFYIQQRIIRQAKMAASVPRVSMKEVAYQVGFMDIAHFSKFFRSQTGMNFTEYKKLLA